MSNGVEEFAKPNQFVGIRNASRTGVLFNIQQKIVSFDNIYY